MTCLWFILPNANDWLDWRTSIVLLDSSRVTAFGSGKSGVRSPLLFSGTPCLVGEPAQNKMGQTRTHMFMQASQNTPILLEFCLLWWWKSLFQSNSLCPTRTSGISKCICAKSFSICSKIKKLGSLIFTRNYLSTTTVIKFLFIANLGFKPTAWRPGRKEARGWFSHTQQILLIKVTRKCSFCPQHAPVMPINAYYCSGSVAPSSGCVVGLLDSIWSFVIKPPLMSEQLSLIMQDKLLLQPLCFSTSTNIRGLKQQVIMKSDWWKGPLIWGDW